MKIIRCRTAQGISYGILEQDTIQLLADVPFEDLKVSGSVSVDAVKLLAPCAPSKIIGIGINYAPHADELKFQVPSEPLIFLKPPTTVIGPGDPVILPPMSEQADYEGELGVVIGRTAKNVAEHQALDYVLGYTCFNDVTARDLQKQDVQFTRSKSFDTFAPMGPWIETDLSPGNLTIETRLNGELRQSSNTGNMIRSVETLISFISQIMTLLPGDVIATGTPAGVGKLSPGDTISVTIEGVGTLTNTVL